MARPDVRARFAEGFAAHREELRQRKQVQDWLVCPELRVRQAPTQLSCMLRCAAAFVSPRLSCQGTEQVLMGQSFWSLVRNACRAMPPRSHSESLVYQSKG
jgi:hypothetical protein